MAQRTYSAKLGEVPANWVLIDAEGVVLGRVASRVALMLRGKHRPQYTPHINCGDNVVVINAEKIRLTGNKRSAKLYHHHTGHPGGIRSITAETILDGSHPERVFKKAVERMIPRTPLGRQQMRNLKIYSGSDHPHSAQSPKLLDVRSLNVKNAPRR